MIREIITYPSPILKKSSHTVVDFDEILYRVLDDMYETMSSRDGIGLAAIQIAEPVNAFIINLVREDEKQYKEDLIEYINPSVLSHEGTTVYQEGCLSIPGVYEDVKRYDSIEVEYFDRFGKKINRDLHKLESIAFQHELDHLHGKLFIEKLSFLKRKKFEKEWKKNLKKKRL